MPSPLSSPLVQLRQVSLGYQGITVIRNATLTIRAGEFLGIIGPNGAGKTTLLRALIGQLKPLSGELHWRSPPPKLGYVPQVQALDPVFPLTVAEVVSMGAYRRLSRWRSYRSERSYFRQCLSEVGMVKLERNPFSQLSAGQKQRVLVARALMSKPELLLLDEPTSGADEGAEVLIMDLLGTLHGQGLAIVLICHEMDTVRQRVQDVVWIHNGELERGKAQELLTDQAIDQRLRTDSR